MGPGFSAHGGPLGKNFSLPGWWS